MYDFVWRIPQLKIKCNECSKEFEIFIEFEEIKIIKCKHCGQRYEIDTEVRIKKIKDKNQNGKI